MKRKITKVPPEKLARVTVLFRELLRPRCPVGPPRKGIAGRVYFPVTAKFALGIAVVFAVVAFVLVVAAAPVVWHDDGGLVETKFTCL